MRARRLVLPVAVFVALFAYFLSIQLASPRLACIDVFFHIRYADLLRHRGFIRDFPWMQFAVFREHWVDQHFLFHLLLIPFTLFGNLLLGAKVAASTFAAAALTAFTVFLRRRRVPYPVFWLLLLLASSAAFLYRMNMVRGQSLAIVGFLVFLDALLERRARLAFATAFAFVWLYQLFPLFILLAVAVALAGLRDRPRPDLRAPGFGLLGLAAGLIVNPFFPWNLVFLYQHAVVKVLNRANLGVGGEWEPFDSWSIVTGNIPVYVALGAALLALLVRPGRASRTSLALAGPAALFFLMHLRSRRFIEYWPPFALLFAASVLADLLPWDAVRRARGFRPAAAVLVLILGWQAARNQRTAIGDLDSNLLPDRYRGGAEWLAAHSQPGEVVFTTDWDDFAELFFYNQKNTYLVGLDPTFMLLHDRTLFYEWDQIANGRLGLAAPVIARDFRSRFVFTDHAHEAFIKLADRDPAYSRAYLDQDCAIYEIRGGGDPAAAFRIEGETRYPPLATSGMPCRIQDLRVEFGVTCSNDRLLFCSAEHCCGEKPEDFVDFEIQVPRAARYAIRAGFVTARDYGIVQVAVDGRSLGSPFDGFAPRVGTAERIGLGEVDLAAGAHRVRLGLVGKNPEASGYCIGLDYLDLEWVGDAAPPSPGGEPPP